MIKACAKCGNIIRRLPCNKCGYNEAMSVRTYQELSFKRDFR